jgi:hypothetical protein
MEWCGSRAVGADWEQWDALNGAELLPTSCYGNIMTCGVSVSAGQATRASASQGQGADGVHNDVQGEVHISACFAALDTPKLMFRIWKPASGLEDGFVHGGA